MNALSIVGVKDILETTLEFFSIRSRSSRGSIDNNPSPLPDPRARLPDADTRPESVAGTDTSSDRTRDVEEVGEIYTGRGVDLQSRSTDELESSSREIARLRSELKLLQDKHYALQIVLQRTQSQARQKEHLIERLQERNEKLEADYRDARKLAEERRVEVKSLEQFLSKTDSWAGSDLVQTMKDMNTEILQFSAAASESFTGECDELEEGPGRTKALEKVGSRFGAKMRQCLEDRDHTQDPSMLQYALQSCLSMHISHALSSFCFGLPGKFDAQLSKIHRHMHETELQPTSARWRALTHRTVYQLTPNIGETAVNDVVQSTMRGVASMLCAAGLGEVDDIVSSLESDFESNLRRIAQSAARVSKVVRENTVSTDFHTVYVEPGREFNPSSMENLYDGYGQSKGRVLCTTEIGLQCFTNVRKDEQDRNSIQRTLVLKPTVVLESAIQFLDET